MQRRNNSVEILVLPRIKKRRKFLKLGVATYTGSCSSIKIFSLIGRVSC